MESVFLRKGSSPLPPFTSPCANFLHSTQIQMADYSQDLEHYQAQIDDLEQRIREIKRSSALKVRALHKEIDEYQRLIAILKQMEAEHAER